MLNNLFLQVIPQNQQLMKYLQQSLFVLEDMAKQIQRQIDVNEYKILFSSREFKKTRVEYFVEHEFNIEKTIPA